MFNRCILLIFLFLLLPVASYAEKNYYDVLGVSRTASKEEIKHAYRRLSMKYHPDRNPSKQKSYFEKKMVEINRAHNILMDDAKRKQYDDFGHEQFTKSGDSKRPGDSFSQVFEDIFKKEEKPKYQSQTYSIKAIQLFQTLLRNKMTIQQSNRRFFGPRNITKQQKLIEITLKELLKEVGISDLHKDTFTRILKDFYGEFPEKERKRLIETISQSSTGKASASQSTKIKLYSPDSIWQSALQKFIENIEARYVVHNSTGKEKKAVELFHRFSFFNQSSKDFLENRTRHLKLLTKRNEKSGLTKAEKTELHGFEKQERKDTYILRQILSALGLPEQVHNDFLLRAYLDGLKQSLFDRIDHKKPGAKMLSYNGTHSGAMYMENKNIIEALRNIKITFDNLQYENLKTIRNPLRLKSLKNFPAQFIVFQLAIGTSLYRQTLTDPYLHGTEKNPGMLTETMKHSLSPLGVASFFIFISVSQALHATVYGWGRSIDGKSIGKLHFNGKGFRASGPGLGLAAGFLASSIFDELLRNPSFQQCVTQQWKSSNSDDNTQSALYDIQHIGPCEESYLNWSSSAKWKHYGVDGATLIVSGLLSHKILSYSLKSIKATSIGSTVLRSVTKFLGLRVSGWLGFFANMYLFMEVYAHLEIPSRFVKEYLTEIGIKDDLVYFTDLLSKKLAELSLYASHLDTPDESSRHTNLFKETISKAEMNIKQLGHKFQYWFMARSQNRIQSAHFLSQKLNKSLLPYESSSSLLKDIFLLSHLNYGQTYPYHSGPWDSDKEISKEKSYWGDLMALISFSGSKFIEKKEFFKNNYCFLINESLDLWNQFCSDPENFSYGREQEASLVYETASLIYTDLLTIPSHRNNTINDNNFMNYLGRTFNEMFSSDPQYSIQKLSYNEKFLLARTLLKFSLTENDIFSHFEHYEILKFKKTQCTSIYPHHETDEEHKLMFEYCLYSLEQIKLLCADSYPKDSQPENYEACLSEFNIFMQELEQKLRDKFLSAGIYVLKDLSTPNFPNRDINYNTSLINTDGFRSISPLVELLKVYKKGEIKFVISKEIFESNKFITEPSQIKVWNLSNSLHFFMKNLVCGEKEPDSDDSFSIPQFFSNTEIFIYNFHSNKFERLSTVCTNLIENLGVLHEFLFDRPVQKQGKNYENLYLALEDILKTNYSSSQNLADHFQKLSQDQLDEIGAQLSNELKVLTENYYKDLINFDTGVNQHSSLQDFTNYYHKSRILFDFRSFTGGLKGLEISLFQVNYWMEMLKQMLSIGEQKNNDGDSSLNQTFSDYFEWKGFDQSAFEKMQWEVLSLLQSYHDSYKKEQEYYLLFPEETFEKNLNEIFKKEGKEGLAKSFGENKTRFTILKKEYQNSHLPVLMSQEIILSHIVDASIPILNNSGLMSLVNINQTIFPKSPWPQMIYSILFEMNKSLNNFFTQFQALQMRDSFEYNFPSSNGSAE